MTFRFKFNSILVLCFALSWLGSSLYFERLLGRLSTEAVATEVRLHMRASLAIREYTQDHVKPYFDARPTEGFEKISVPAFAAQRTLELLYRDYPGYQYREAVLNPTNPKNRAQGWEQALVERYRQSAGEDEEVAVIASQDGQSLHAVKPIRIYNADCLHCHGDPNEAPKGMRARYPGSGGFGWQYGEVVGAQIVTVPYEQHNARFQKLRQHFGVALVLIFGSLFVLLNVLLKRVVLNPLQHNNSTLNALAETDPLTALANRRAFDQGLDRGIAIAREQQQTLALLMLDIDHFKCINDEFGHGTGDDVLRQLARELAKKFRTADLFARLGGEEFIAMLPGMALADAQQRAQVLCDLCASIDFGLGRPLTISVGVAQWDGSETAPKIIERCDAALYQAKHQGRNRVVSAT